MSQPAPVPPGINGNWQSVVFDFSRTVIPINATDVFLQIVYRGPLGDEGDAIVVTTKDISEPTYNYTFNTWDQWLYCAGGIISSTPPCTQQYTFEQSFCQQAEPQLTLAQCRARNGRTAKVRGNPIAHPVPGYDPSSPAVPPDQTFYDMTIVSSEIRKPERIEPTVLAKSSAIGNVNAMPSTPPTTAMPSDSVKISIATKPLPKPSALSVANSP